MIPRRLHFRGTQTTISWPGRQFLGLCFPRKIASKTPSSTTTSHTTRGTKSSWRAPGAPKPEPTNGAEIQTLEQLFNERRLPILGMGAMACLLGYYIVKLIKSYSAQDADAGHPGPKRLSPKQYDKSLDFPEWFMGITLLRQKMIARARGDVLEVGMGTGRNLLHYAWIDDDNSPREPAEGETKKHAITLDVTTFTGLDISDDMLKLSRYRTSKMLGQDYYANRVRILQGDSQSPLPAPPGGRSSRYYDTVIQTFGLCSVDDPVAVLRNLSTVVMPSTGRILLLEHGRGTWPVVNSVLDSQAEKHHKKHGCWWNRDIEAIVREAVDQVPRLELVRIDRPYILQGGTVLAIELKVRPLGLADKEAPAEKSESLALSGSW